MVSENKAPVNKPTKKPFEKYKPMSLFLRFYGTLLKLLCKVNQSFLFYGISAMLHGTVAVELTWTKSEIACQRITTSLI